MTWLSLLCPSCRPDDLKKWLNTLYYNCKDPKGIELSLTLEKPIFDYRWGGLKTTYVNRGQYNINQLTEICYKQSTSPYIFLSGDDTICKTSNWDVIFKNELQKYSDNIVLLYPDDTIFHQQLACYPVTSRLVMDSVKWPVPYDRYCVDDTIFDIVPYDRRIYLPNVIMEHLHLVEQPPGHPIERDGKTWYYPHDVGAMAKDRNKYIKLQPERDAIRNGLASRIVRKEMKLLVAVPTAEMTRYGVFYDYLNMLQFPPGTNMSFSRGQSPAAGRNILIDHALNNGFSHILFIDDDVLVKPDLVYQLARHDKDIVTALYLMRNYPHQPIIFDAVDEHARCHHHYLEDNESGLIEIVGCGLGACLIKTDVFRALTKPYIRLGELDLENWCDDLGFFNRVRKAGIRMYCDLDTQVGHIASVSLWPTKVNNKWVTAYNTYGKESPSVPAAEDGASWCVMETIETLNQRLIDTYGIFEDGSANWRVVWSEDQIEKRLTEYTKEGFALPRPEVIEAPKYRQWIQNKYILERLIPLNAINQVALLANISYEPIWIFQDNSGNPLPPLWEPIKIIIETVYKNISESQGVKYKDPLIEYSKAKESEQKEMDWKRLAELQQELFGDESRIGDSLARQDAVGYGPKH